MFYLNVTHFNTTKPATTHFSRHSVLGLVNAIENDTDKSFDDWLANAGMFDGLLGTLELLDFDDSPDVEGTAADFVEGMAEHLRLWLLRVAPFETVREFTSDAYDEHVKHIRVSTDGGGVIVGAR